MPDFIRVDNMDAMKFSSRWKKPTAFHSQGRYINKYNQYVKVTYPGPMYQVMIKRERNYSGMERLTRFAQGVFYTLLTLGLCNLMKSYRGLFNDGKKICRIAVRVPNENNTDSQIDVKPAKKEALDETGRLN